MNTTEIKNFIEDGNAILGIEFGSTRIKLVLINDFGQCLAKGNHTWENRYENGMWTYTINDVITGLQDSYYQMSQDVMDKYGIVITKLRSIGLSAMMHGYLAFNNQDSLLVPFRTWRNTFTQKAADELTELFQYNIPQRWSIAHLYHAILNKEDHVKNISFITTLAGYVHWKLTGKKVLGVGDASGMFPIDSSTLKYNTKMLDKFNQLISNYNFPWELEDILPKVYKSGENAGALTLDGAHILDKTGNLKAGSVFCPPEGDAGTGMVATKSVAVNTGNVSAGTSIFAMIVLDKEIENVHKEIDMVTTPDGKPVAMVHCNNCSSQLDTWVNIFKEFSDTVGGDIPKSKIYDILYNKALEGESNAGGVIMYNYISGEPITNMEKGCPMIVRNPNSRLNLANFMRAHIYSIFATLCIGLDLLQKDGVTVKKLIGHGGLFITPVVAQSILASATNIPVTIMETASEGGAWGIAVLSAYTSNKNDNESLSDFLNRCIFNDTKEITVNPNEKDVEGFKSFMNYYKKGLSIEQKAIEQIHE